MDGAIDVRLVVTIAGILVSVAGASAVARSQIQRIQEMLKDIENRMRQADSRVDQLENSILTNGQRLDVISDMMSPANMEIKARESATILARLDVIERMQHKIEARVGLNGHKD